MNFKKVLKLLRNPEVYLHFCLYEQDGWGHFAYHEGVKTAQEMLDYWNQHPDEPCMDGMSYLTCGYAHLPQGAIIEFCPSKEELQKLAERGY